jgi:small-conductance mechanosensitive channel
MEYLQTLVEFLSRALFTVYGRTYTVGQVIIVPLVALIGLFIIGRVEATIIGSMTRRGRDRNLVLLFNRLYLIAAYVALGLIILSLLHIPLTAFAFVSGALAIGVGFGAQNIVNNFISGWILMWERPIRIGDTIEVSGMSGTVETINTRSTRIRRADGVRLLVPNSQLLENPVLNSNLVDNLGRGQVRVGVDYASDVRKVEALINQALQEHPAVCASPRPAVQFDDFAQGALVFNILFWVDMGAGSDLGTVRSDLRYRLHELFSAGNIDLAYGATAVQMAGELRLTPPPSQDANLS